MKVVRNWRLWLGLLVSLLFLYLAIHGLDFGALWQALAKANYWYLAPALAAYFAGVYIRSIRWAYILSPTSPPSATGLFPVVVIGYMANDLLPARMGELVRTYVAGSKLGIPRSKALMTIVIERLMDGIAMLAFAGTALILIPTDPDLKRGLGLTLAVFVLATAAILMAHRFRAFLLSLTDFLLGYLPERLGGRIQTIISSAMEGFEILGSPKPLLMALATSVAAWGFEAGMYALIAQGFGLPLTPVSYLMLVAVANLATLIPSSPGYVGTFEAASIAVLVALMGLPRDMAVAYVLVLHASLYFPVTLLGLAYWWHASLSLDSVLRSRPVQEDTGAR